VSVDPDDPMRKLTLDQILACRILTQNGFENIFLAPGRQAQNGTNAEKAFVIAGCSGFFVQKISTSRPAVENGIGSRDDAERFQKILWDFAWETRSRWCRPNPAVHGSHAFKSQTLS